jgi:hypothetical protein
VTTQRTVEVKDIEVFARNLDPRQAAAIYQDNTRIPWLGRHPRFV